MQKFLGFLVFFGLSLVQVKAANYTPIQDRATLPILTPEFKERQVQKLRLPNGLEAMVISDPQTDKSGAVLSVHAGSWEDPKEYPGLAHFLEHMLFMGTKEFPDEASYHRFISENGGLANAYTANTETNYMFSIDNRAFTQALRHFSSFFKEPLFNPSGVARELNAIDQEYAKNLDNDDWRILYVDKTQSNPDHPYYNFNIGNTGTLSKVSREVLTNWYKQHYSANLMRLVVVAPLPIDQLVDLVVQDFSGVPNNDHNLFTLNQSLTAADAKPTFVYVEPVKDTRTLTILWKLPREFADMKDGQPLTVACHVLGHEGEESLLAQLKRETLADKITCGKYDLGDRNVELALEITLTDEGVKQVETVINRVFQTIANFRQKGYPRYLFDEINHMAVVDYKYQQREDLFQKLMTYAALLQKENMDTFPEQTLIVQQYSPKDVQALLDYITPQHARYYIGAPEAVTGITADRKEPWLGAAYTVRSIDPKLIQNWDKSTPHPSIDLPKSNIFVPHKLALVDQDAHTKPDGVIPHPELVLNNDQGRVYYAPDHLYKVPKSAILFKIKTPQIDLGNPNKVVLADLYVKSLKEAIKPMSYPAQQAGLDYEIKRDDFGIELEVYGYSDNADLLFQEILKKLKTVQPSEDEFNDYKTTLLREYQNAAKESPLQQAFETFRSVIYKRFSTSKQKVQAIEPVTYQKFLNFNQELFQESYLEGIIYGNMTKEEAHTVTQDTLAALDSKPAPRERHRKQQIIILPDQQGPFYLENFTPMQGSAVILGIQGDPTFTFKARAAQQLLMQAIKEPFFSELRTRQQTGYIVYSEGLETKKQLIDLFAVQSNTHAVRDLLARFELFIEGFLQEITDEIPEERFNAIKEVLIKILEQPPKGIKEMADLLQRMAFEYDGDFDWVTKRIQGLKDLSYSAFIEEAHKNLGRNNKRRVAILMSGSVPKDKFLDYVPLKNIGMIKRISEFTLWE